MTVFQIICLVFYLLLLALLLFLIGAFAGSETALTSANKLSLHNQADNGNENAKRACWFLDHFDTFLSTVLLGTNLITVSFVTIAGIVIDKYIFGIILPPLPTGWGEPVTSIIITPIVLLFGEIIPKAVARQFPEKISLQASLMLKLSLTILKPTVAAISFLSNGLIRLLGLKHENATSNSLAVTTDDIRTMADLAAEQGVMLQESGDWLKSVLDMDTKTVNYVMTPLVDICSLPLHSSFTELEQLTAKSSFQVLPVYDGRVDNIVGVISLQKVLENNRSDEEDLSARTIENMVDRDILFVPENMSLNALRAEFQISSVSLAIVVDEYGGMIGLVTLRDLIAQIVGSLQAPNESSQRSHSDNCLICDGKLPIRELEDSLDLSLPQGDYETVAGLVLKLAGRIPKVNDSFSFNNLKLTILEREQHRISLIKAEKTADDDSNGSPE